jgi:replicative DNA helicase
MINTGFVEKALIGAFLNDAGLLTEVPWLEHEDFTNPLCQALWTELARRHAATTQASLDIVALAERLAATTELHPHNRSAAAIAQLQFDAPARPAVAAYGQILVEATTRRQVLALGLQLSEIDPARPADGLRHIAAITHALDHATHRLEHPHGRQHTVVEKSLPEATRAQCANIDGIEPAVRESVPASGSSESTGMSVHLAQAAVLGAALHDAPAGSRDHVMGVVYAYDITDTSMRTAWEAVTDLHRAGKPVDEITVQWELAHRASADRPILTVTQLRDTRNAAIFYEQAAHVLAAATAARLSGRLPAILARLEASPTVDVQTVTDSVSASATAIGAALQRLLAMPEEFLSGTPHQAAAP